MFKKILSLTVIVCFVLTSLGPIPKASAGTVLGLPEPGTMVNLSPAYVPVLIKGLKVHPENPLLFDFILDSGRSGLKINSPEFKNESEKLIKYFLASLTIKEDDLWVNLSPYEKNRIIPEQLGQTELGRDMLAQDYILKQLTASLIYPEKQLGKEFWNTVYAKAQHEFGTSDIPVNTFNKVWIIADKAKILERNNVGYVVGSHLKVMLEEDYLALEKHNGVIARSPAFGGTTKQSHTIASQVVREIIIPELEKEVNQGQNFAPLRQMFYSMILASWYKLALKDALLNQVYSNKGKTGGILSDDPMVKDKIFQQYLKAYKKGVFNYIKEEMDTVSNQTIPRKYFSGGVSGKIVPVIEQAVTEGDNIAPDGAMAVVRASMDRVQNGDTAMLAANKLSLLNPSNGVKKVLVVDDAAYHRQPISNALILAGYDVTDKEDGLSALNFMTSAGADINEVADVVITDKDMVQMNGDTLIRKLREKGFRGPIVLITNDPEGVEVHGWATKVKAADGIYHFYLNEEGVRVLGKNTILMQKVTSGELAKEPYEKVVEIVNRLNKGEVVDVNTVVDRNKVAADGRLFSDADLIDRQIDSVLAGGQIKGMNDWAIRKGSLFNQEMVNRILRHLEDVKLDKNIRLRAIEIIDILFYQRVPVIFTIDNVARYINSVEDLETFSTRTKGQLRIPIYTAGGLEQALEIKSDLLDTKELRDKIEGMVAAFETAQKMDVKSEVSDTTLGEELENKFLDIDIQIRSIKTVVSFYKANKVLAQKEFSSFSEFQASVEKGNIQTKLAKHSQSDEAYESGMGSLKKLFDKNKSLFHKLIREIVTGGGIKSELDDVEEISDGDFDRQYPGLVKDLNLSIIFGLILNALVESEAVDYAMTTVNMTRQVQEMRNPDAAMITDTRLLELLRGSVTNVGDNGSQMVKVGLLEAHLNVQYVEEHRREFAQGILALSKAFNNQYGGHSSVKLTDGLDYIQLSGLPDFNLAQRDFILFSAVGKFLGYWDVTMDPQLSITGHVPAITNFDMDKVNSDAAMTVNSVAKNLERFLKEKSWGNEGQILVYILNRRIIRLSEGLTVKQMYSAYNRFIEKHNINASSYLEHRLLPVEKFTAFRDIVMENKPETRKELLSKLDPKELEEFDNYLENPLPLEVLRDAAMTGLPVYLFAVAAAIARGWHTVYSYKLIQKNSQMETTATLTQKIINQFLQDHNILRTVPKIPTYGNAKPSPVLIVMALQASIGFPLGEKEDLENRLRAAYTENGIEYKDAAMFSKFTVLKIKLMSDVNKIAAYLNDEDSGIRKAAMDRLDKIVTVPEKKSPILTDALKNSNSDVRIWAVRGLGYLIDTGSEHLVDIGKLLGMLKDEDGDVISSAEEVLTKAKVSKERMLNAYKAALLSTYIPKRNAIKKLGELGNKDAIKPLSRMLQDEVHYEIAGEALEKLGASNEQMVDGYLAVLKLPLGFKSVYYNAIKKLGDLRNERAIEPVIKLLKDKRYYIKAEEALTKWVSREQIIEGYIAALPVGHDFSNNVIERLKVLGGKSAQIAGYIIVLSSKDGYDRRIAVQMLGKLHNEPGIKRAIIPLYGMLNDRIVRLLVENNLRVLGEPTEKMVELYYEDLLSKNERFLIHALQGLAEVSTKDHNFIIDAIKRLDPSTHELVRQTLLRSKNGKHHSSVEEALRKLEVDDRERSSKQDMLQTSEELTLDAAMLSDAKFDAYEIKDSRGKPTVEASLTINGHTVKANVPAGASKGEDEANTVSIAQAINNILERIAPALKLSGLDLSKHEDLVKADRMLMTMGENDNFASIGANATVPVSRALWKMAAAINGMELGQYIRQYEPDAVFENNQPTYFYMNIFNGGLHALQQEETLGVDRIDFQEVMIAPVASTYVKALNMGDKIDKALKELLLQHFPPERITRADEAGFSVKGLGSTDEAIKYVIEAIRRAGFQPGKDVKLALDVAASTFYGKKESGKYDFQNQLKTSQEMIAYYKELSQKYHGILLSIEDGLDENDWDYWPPLTTQMKGDEVETIGDDLFVTQESRFKKGIQLNAASAILIKVNQNGTMTGTLDIMKLAKQNHKIAVVSHRSGETLDDSIADLAWGTKSFGLKTGDPQPAYDFGPGKPYADRQLVRRIKYERMIALERLENQAKAAMMAVEDNERAAAKNVGNALHKILNPNSPDANKFLQGGYEQEGYGVAAGAVIDGNFAIDDEGNQGYYVNKTNVPDGKGGFLSGKEVFVNTVNTMKEIFERRKPKIIIKIGIGGQHTPFQGIADAFQAVDPKTGKIIGEYELGKNWEESLAAVLKKYNVDWKDVFIIPSSKSGSTDETMSIFVSILSLLLEKVSTQEGLKGKEFSKSVIDYLHQINFDKEGKELPGKDLFKDFKFNELVRKIKEKNPKATRKNVLRVFQTVLGNMFFETTDRPADSRLSAFFHNAHLVKLLGLDNAPGLVYMFDNVGGRWTGDLHMMIFLAINDLDPNTYWEKRYAGIKAVRKGSDYANVLGNHILDKGIKKIAFVVPDELFWFGMSMEQNFNESIWQQGFANLRAIKESEWPFQAKNYRDTQSMIINLSERTINSQYRVDRTFSREGSKEEIAQDFSRWFTLFYGMTYTVGTRLIARALKAKGLKTTDIDINDLSNPATKILQENLFLRQPFVELGKGLLQKSFEALQLKQKAWDRDKQVESPIDKAVDEMINNAKNKKVETDIPELKITVDHPWALADLIAKTIKLAKEEKRTFVPFIYLEGDKYVNLRKELVKRGIEWVLQGTGAQHISYQQVLANPDKYLPFFVSFVPIKENIQPGVPAVFIKGYLDNISPNLIRHYFAKFSYQALINQPGGKAVFVNMLDTLPQIDALTDNFKHAIVDSAMTSTMEWTDVQGDINKWLPLARQVKWNDINQDMFRDYDYRYVKDGVALKPEIVFILALVWAKMALKKAAAAGITTRDVLVARDARKIEPEIVDAEIAALRYAGLNVVFVGDEPNCVTSYSWAVQSRPWLMTIFNTASHVSKPDHMIVRGFKVTQLGAIGGNVLSLTTKEIKNESLILVKGMVEHKTAIEKMEAGESGKLSRKAIEADAIRFNTAVGLLAANHRSLYQFGQNIKLSGADAQVGSVLERFGQDKPLAGLTVVVEGSHTPSGPLAAGVFQNLGADVEGINLDVQEISGSHSADPSIDKNLGGLKMKIIETHANFGIAFDLDGDRGAILIPEWNTDGTTVKEFHMLAPDNILGMLMPHLLKDWGYTDSGKKIGVIRDVLGTYGVNDAAKKNNIEMFQTDAGYVYLKALKERMEPQGYVFPVYGERSGHTWLNVSGEIENPVAVAVLFSTIVAKLKNPTDVNGVLNLYKESSIPYSQSPRFQPFYHPKFLQWLAEHNGSGWRYVLDENPPQAIVALGKDETIKRLSHKFWIGATFGKHGEYQVSEFNTYKDPIDEGGLYRFADIMFQKNGQFVGRVVVRASSNDPTFVMSYEAPILNGDVQEANRNRVMTSGFVMQYMIKEELGIFTREQMAKFMNYSPDKQEEQFNKANLGPVEDDLKSFADAAMNASSIKPAAVLSKDEETDSAMGETQTPNITQHWTRGGIDLNSQNMQMDISGQKINIQFDPAMLAQFKRGDFSGIKPVIMSITPIVNVMPLLGLVQNAKDLDARAAG